MSSLETSNTSKIKIKSIPKKKKKDLEIYSPAIITRSINIPIINIGKNLKDTLKIIIVNEIQGKCISEGYIKEDSITIISYSNGVVDGYIINFNVVFECLVCNPVEGMIITCIAKNITKAGIRAQLSEENNPLVIFIARDHNYMSKNFSSIEDNQIIKIRVIGKRFELNDTYISIIAELYENKQNNSKQKVPLITSNKEVSPIIETETLVNNPTTLQEVTTEPIQIASPTPEVVEEVNPTPEVVVEASPEPVVATPEVVEATPQLVEATPEVVEVSPEVLKSTVSNNEADLT